MILALAISLIGDTYFITNLASKQDSFLKYLPLLSPLIVIVTFMFNNWYTVQTKRKESRRTWYFKAYFEPQVKKVEEFFSIADLQMKDALDVFVIQSKTMNTKEVTEYIGHTLFTLANLKRKFELEVVKIFQSTYPEIFTSLESALMNFEDACSKAFEKNSTDPYFTFLDEITQIKAHLIQALSGPALK